MTARLTRLVAESPGAVPSAVLMIVFTWFAADEAGFRGVTYLPGEWIADSTHRASTAQDVHRKTPR